MTEFSIYQINVDRDTANVCFIGMLPLRQRGSSPSRLTLRRNTVRNSNSPNAL